MNFQSMASSQFSPQSFHWKNAIELLFSAFLLPSCSRLLQVSSWWHQTCQIYTHSACKWQKWQMCPSARSSRWMWWGTRGVHAYPNHPCTYIPCKVITACVRPWHWLLRSQDFSFHCVNNHIQFYLFSFWPTTISLCNYPDYNPFFPNKILSNQVLPNPR